MSTPRSKRVALAAITATAALVLAGCSGGSTETADVEGKDVGAMADYAVGTTFKATEPLDFSLLFSDHPNYPLKKDWLLWSEITDRTNVTLDPTVVPMSDYEQKRSLLVGAGDAPLIIPKTYPGQEEAFVSSGAILPISEYTEYMPNFTQKVADWGLEDNIDQLRQADGTFYVLPGLHEAPWQDYTIAMRTDILDDLGLEEPQTWDEFREVLRAIKKDNPDIYPMSDRFMGESLLNIASVSFGSAAGWHADSVVWDEDKGEFVFAGATDNHKAMIEYLHSLVEEGLLDPESFTQDDDSAIQKFVSGRSAAISTNAQMIVNDYRPALTDTVDGAEVAKITLPAGPAGNVIAGTTQLENGLMINAKAAESENFEALLQFVDWLWYSDEGQELTKWGVEGVTFTRDADGGYELADDVDYVGLNPGAEKHLQVDFGFGGGNFAYGGTTELLQSTFSDE
ncbi:MAG: ABC transporter substrate-binding protein, partial [Mycetocola sp.]